MFQCGIKQRKALHEILNCLKGVVTKVGCGQPSFEHSVVLENFLTIGTVSNHTQDIFPYGCNLSSHSEFVM